MLKHLYAHLVHFTERKIRNAVRLEVAYVYLLRRYGNNMAAVANYLRISRSYAYPSSAA